MTDALPNFWKKNHTLTTQNLYHGAVESQLFLSGFVWGIAIHLFFKRNLWGPQTNYDSFLTKNHKTAFQGLMLVYQSDSNEIFTLANPWPKLAKPCLSYFLQHTNHIPFSKFKKKIQISPNQTYFFLLTSKTLTTEILNLPFKARPFGLRISNFGFWTCLPGCKIGPRWLGAVRSRFWSCLAWKGVCGFCARGRDSCFRFMGLLGIFVV
jgi:hypothetical protein